MEEGKCEERIKKRRERIGGGRRTGVVWESGKRKKCRREIGKQRLRRIRREA